MGLSRYRINDDNWDYFKEIQFFFDSFGFYVDEINKFIKQEIEKAKESYDKFKIETENDLYWGHEWFDYFSNFQAKEGLTDIYYDSLITNLYSFLERKMFSLCKHLSKPKDIKLDDISGKGIFKYRKYLNKVCGIDFSKIENEWKLLTDYNKLRNQIVHSEGVRSIPKKDEPIITFLKGINGIVFIEDGDAFIFHYSTNQILLNFITISKTIIDHLYIEQVKFDQLKSGN